MQGTYIKIIHCSDCTQRFSQDDALKIFVKARRARLVQRLHWACARSCNEKALCLLSPLIHLFCTLSSFFSENFRRPHLT